MEHQIAVQSSLLMQSMEIEERCEMRCHTDSWVKLIEKNSTWHTVSQNEGRNFSIIQGLKWVLFKDLENIVINLFGVKCVNYFYCSMSLKSVFPSFMPYLFVFNSSEIKCVIYIYIVNNRTMINYMNNYQRQLNNSDG